MQTHHPNEFALFGHLGLRDMSPDEGMKAFDSEVMSRVVENTFQRHVNDQAA